MLLNIKNMEPSEKLISAIIGAKTATALYHYPTRTVGTSYLGEDTADEYNNTQDHIDHRNSGLVNAVDQIINEVCADLNISRDNKIAVKCDVVGFDTPLFFCSYDNRRIICGEIRPEGVPTNLELVDGRYTEC